MKEQVLKQIVDSGIKCHLGGHSSIWINWDKDTKLLHYLQHAFGSSYGGAYGDTPGKPPTYHSVLRFKSDDERDLWLSLAGIDIKYFPWVKSGQYTLIHCYDPSLHYKIIDGEGNHVDTVWGSNDKTEKGFSFEDDYGFPFQDSWYW